MKPEEFKIGTEFYTNLGQFKWRCTDIGTRVVVAIRLEPVEITVTNYHGGKLYSILTQQEAEKEGWFIGPPYKVGEDVFDEYDLKGCTLTREE